MINNSGLIRQLKKATQEIPTTKKIKKDPSFFISILALLISVASIYFQFFYEKFNLSTSIIDAEVYKDSISLDLIYHNKGNQDATVTNTEIFFYSDKNKMKDTNHIQFNNKNEEPYILSPGKQIFKKFVQQVYFLEDSLLIKTQTNIKDTIRVQLRISYLRDNSLEGEKVVNCGWITLDNQSKIDNWLIKYQKIKSRF